MDIEDRYFQLIETGHMVWWAYEGYAEFPVYSPTNFTLDLEIIIEDKPVLQYLNGYDYQLGDHIFGSIYNLRYEYEY